jgi:hypothetical protein
MWYWFELPELFVCKENEILGQYDRVDMDVWNLVPTAVDLPRQINLGDLASAVVGYERRRQETSYIFNYSNTVYNNDIIYTL